MASKVTLKDELLFPSDYIAAFDCNGNDLTLTITSVSKQELQIRGGGKKVKPVLTFKEAKKKLVLNVTNAESISILHGPRAESWVGKQVTFYPTQTQMGRQTVDCLRVREVAPPAQEETVANDPDAAAIREWHDALAADPTLDQLNEMVGTMRTLEKDLKNKVWSMMLKITKAHGLVFDRKENKFIVNPEAVPA